MKVVLQHPICTIGGIERYRKQKRRLLDYRQSLSVSPVVDKKENEANTIVGVGFCLKPLHPPCLSGRGNHDCLYFERNLDSARDEMPACCQHCAIREIGLRARAAGNHFYIMTSARDILEDMLLPALENKQFSKGLFAICRYSFEPFQIALAIAGIEGDLYPYEINDCNDFSTWNRADRGIKDDQTKIGQEDYQSMQNHWLLTDRKETPPGRFQKRGNIFSPL